LPPGALEVAGRVYGPAGFGPRLLAFLLDCLLLATLFGVVVYLVDLPAADTARELRLAGKLLQQSMRLQVPDQRLQDELNALQRPQVFLGWLNVLFCGTYFILCHGLAGRTVGKALCGLSVLRTTGQPLGLGRAALRYLVYFALARLFYGTFTMAFDPQRRAVHDFTAGSNVYRELRWR
jgi:uncharacterized RDD family membrane protein YckC